MSPDLELLMTRRSVRSYTDEPVSDEDVEAILRAAMAAPSAGDERPWHFIVIGDRQIMERIMEVHPYAAMLAQAPVCLAVSTILAADWSTTLWSKPFSLILTLSLRIR